MDTKNYIENAKSAATRRAYQSDWKHFTLWCAVNGLHDLPAAPETVCLYVSALARSCKVATITRRLAAISVAHQAAREETPTRSTAVRLTMQGIRRVNGTAQTQKAPATIDVLRSMVAQLEPGVAGVRDRAILLLGFAGAFRRSELAGLDAADLAFNDHGIEVLLRRSKTDQEGAGVKVAIPYGSRLDTCPVRSVRAWIDAAGLERGPLFVGVNRHGQLQGRLSGHAVAAIVKRYAALAGLDADLFGGHSLRAGLVTAAAIAGVQERVIQKQSRHKSVTILRRYIRDGDLWRENAAVSVGL